MVFGAFIATRATNIDASVHAAWPYLLLSFVVSSGIIVLQYARRRTLIARLILVGSLVLLILLPVFLATKITPLYFPSVSASRPTPVTFAFDPNPSRRPHGMNMEGNGQYISLFLPVVVSGVRPASLAVTEGIQFTLTSSDGKTYTSPWRSNGAVYRPEANGALKYVNLLVPSTFFDQVKSTSVTAHITFGVGQLRPSASMTIPFPSGKVDIPGIGICSGVTSTPDYDGSNYNLACTVALRSPVYTEVTARWSDNKCNQPQPSVDQLIRGDGVIGTYDSDPADFGLSPIIQQQINFSNGVVPLPSNAARQRYLCAGTPLTFTPYSLAYRASVDFTAPNLNLADYLPKSIADAKIGFNSVSASEE